MGDGVNDDSWEQEVANKVARNTLRHVVQWIWQGTGDTVVQGVRGLDQGHHRLMKVIVTFVVVAVILLYVAYAIFRVIYEKFPSVHGYIHRAIWLSIILITLTAMYWIFV